MPVPLLLLCSFLIVPLHPLNCLFSLCLFHLWRLCVCVCVLCDNWRGSCKENLLTELLSKWMTIRFRKTRNRPVCFSGLLNQSIDRSVLSFFLFCNHHYQHYLSTFSSLSLWDAPHQLKVNWACLNWLTVCFFAVLLVAADQVVIFKSASLSPLYHFFTFSFLLFALTCCSSSRTIPSVIWARRRRRRCRSRRCCCCLVWSDLLLCTAQTLCLTLFSYRRISTLHHHHRHYHHLNNQVWREAEIRNCDLVVVLWKSKLSL